MRGRGYRKLAGLDEYSDLNKRTLRTLIKEQGLPYYRLPSGLILVKLSEFDEWMEQFRVGKTAQDIAQEMFDGS